MKIQSPLDGKPKTIELKDSEGKISLKVTPRELTPFRALIVEAISRLGAAALIGFGTYYVVVPVYPYFEDMAVKFGIVLVASLILYKILSFFLSWVLAKRTTIIFSSDHLTIKTLFSCKSYDRHLPHKFYLLQHDKTPTELEIREMQASRPSILIKGLERRRYYADSFHIVFEYTQTRIDLMTVYKQKPASTILARLKLCDEMMQNQLTGNDGTALKPQDQWRDQPGAIGNVANKSLD